MNLATKEGVQTHLLRHNKGMVRDCWWEMDGDQPVLILRQMKFGEMGDQPECKMFRLVGAEIEILRQVISEIYQKSSREGR